MVDDRDKKRTVIVDGTGPQDTLKDGDDIPEREDQAPNTGNPSVKPISIQDMAKHLRSLTQDSQNGNTFAPTETVNLSSLHDSDGNPVTPVSPRNSLGQGELGQRDVFAGLELLEELDIIGQTFDSETLRMLRDPDVGLHDVLRSIIGSSQIVTSKTDGTPQGSSSGQAQVPTPADAPAIQKKISDVLKRNRFNPSGQTPFVPVGSAASAIDTRPIGRSQTDMGGYDNRPVDENTGITYEQMKKIGLALMLRATGEFIGRDGDPTGAGIGAGALLPGEAQLAATRLGRKSMWASDLTDAQGVPPGLGKEGTRFGLDSDLILDDGDGSYGNLNSFIEPFNGFAPVGMTALAAAMVVVVAGLVKVFTEIIDSPAVSDSAAGLGTIDRSIRPMGQSTPRDDSIEFAASTFGVATTRHNYGAAVDRGIDVFFGFDGTDFQRIVLSPGYYAVMVRAIVRSSATVIRSITESFSNNPNPIAAIQALLGIVDIIRSSKIVGFMNVVAVLGDNVLTLEDQGFLSENSLGLSAEAGALPHKGKISIIDRLVDNAATHVMKSRAVEDDTALAWRTSSTPSNYLLPANVIIASKQMPRGTTTAEPEKAFGGLSDLDYSSASSRLSAEVTQKLEDELDSEYVPFYFHDLRTNEIVSFHAFLSEISDDFSANYSRDKYYGRVDPVMIYSDTDRTINITFNVVSTSEEDFDVMWWKINKLVTLLYPQWSKGRKLKTGNDTFIQPFSQIPTSSPVIRLRLGDIFRSNYSKFSLSRLFGLGTTDFDLEGTQSKIFESERRDVLEKRIADIRKIFDRQVRDPARTANQPDDGWHSGDTAILRKQNKDLVLAPAGFGVTGNKMKRTDSEFIVTVGERELKPIDGSLTTVYRVTIKDPPDGFLDGPYLVAHKELKPDVSLEQQAEAEEQATAEQQAIERFFSSENNAVVRSFESVRGRGLAGVVTNMSFDWFTPTWETSTLNSRAPQWCKITMSYQPIHDIAPGIGPMGDNRAPVYPVGNIASRMAGDPYDDGANEREFKRVQNSIRKNVKKQG